MALRAADIEIQQDIKLGEFLERAEAQIDEYLIEIYSEGVKKYTFSLRSIFSNLGASPEIKRQVKERLPKIYAEASWNMTIDENDVVVMEDVS